MESTIDMSPMELLPTEILERILGYLPVHDRIRVERVCKRWQNVSSAERLWRDIQELQITGPKQEKSNSADISEMSARSIRVDGNKLYIPADEIGAIRGFLFRAGRHIKELTFLFNTSRTRTKAMVSIIAARCHNIKLIHFCHAEDTAAKVLLGIMKINKKLKSIACVETGDNIIEVLPEGDWKTYILAVKPY